MNAFMQTHRLVLTPLSPIHIGAGEVFEPTNFVIDRDRGLLYGFNPAMAALTVEERRQLLAAIGSDISRINKFYADHVATYRPWADSIVPVSKKAMGSYRKMLNPQGNQKNTQLEIARVMYERRNGVAEPYVPGSSLKGVFSTALQNRLNDGRRAGWGEDKRSGPTERILGGNLENSPMRFVKVGDMHANGAVFTEVNAADRYFKQTGKTAGIASCFEAVAPAQYRVFSGDVTLTGGMNLKVANVYSDARSIMRDAHAYGMANWRDDLKLIDWFDKHKLQSPDPVKWVQSVKRLLEALEPAFREGRAALVHVGKNAGAESKTLQGAGVAMIQIRHRKRPPETLDHSTTIWLTNDNPCTFGEGEVANGLPYGWAVLELDPEGENAALKTWCEAERRRTGADARMTDVVEEWRSVRAERDALDERRRKDAEEFARREAQKAAREAAERAEEARRAEAMAGLSEEAREGEEICTQLEKAPGAVRNGTELFKRVQIVMTQALGWTSVEEKKAFALKIQSLLKKRDMFQGKAEKEFKKQLRALRGEA